MNNRLVAIHTSTHPEAHSADHHHESFWGLLGRSLGAPITFSLPTPQFPRWTPRMGSACTPRVGGERDSAKGLETILLPYKEKTTGNLLWKLATERSPGPKKWKTNKQRIPLNEMQIFLNRVHQRILPYAELWGFLLHHMRAQGQPITWHLLSKLENMSLYQSIMYTKTFSSVAQNLHKHILCVQLSSTYHLQLHCFSQCQCYSSPLSTKPTHLGPELWDTSWGIPLSPQQYLWNPLTLPLTENSPCYFLSGWVQRGGQSSPYSL